MQLITDHLSHANPAKQAISLKADRRQLAKRRWRGQAEDGTEFGFDLPHPLKHGTPFHETDTSCYLIEQLPEAVLRIPFSNGQQGAFYGWMVGNMHFPADFRSDAIIAEDDPAVRQMLDRNHIHYHESHEILQPAITASGHHHH